MCPIGTESIPLIDRMAQTRGAGISRERTQPFETAMHAGEFARSPLAVSDVDEHTLPILGDAGLQERDPSADQRQTGGHGVEERPRRCPLRSA